MTWPNWVDLIIVILVIRTCYSGFARGLLTECLHLAGTIALIALTMNYTGQVTAIAQPFLAWVGPTRVPFVVFIVMLCGLMFGLRLLLKMLARVLKWERVHWAIQGLGLLVGGVRGVWWAGFLLVVLTSSGVVYFQRSVEERSVLGPKLASTAHEVLGQVAEYFPGAAQRGMSLVPPIIPGASAH